MTDPGAFLDEIATELVLQAPGEVQASILSDEGLRGELLAFQAAARDGLWGVVKKTTSPEQLEAELRARKSAVVARASAHAYTIERLVSSAVTKIVARAREIARGGA